VKTHEPILGWELASDLLDLCRLMVIGEGQDRPNIPASLHRTFLCAAPMVGIDTFDLAVRRRHFIILAFNARHGPHIQKQADPHDIRRKPWRRWSAS
jgi:hypothetical protein